MNTDILREANIPEKYDKLDIDTFPFEQAALTRANQYIKAFKKVAPEDRMGLFIWGAKGTGRTFLAVHVMRQLMIQGLALNVLRITLDELLDAVFQQKERTGDAYIRSFGLLCVDNLDTALIEHRGPAVNAALLRLMQLRADVGRPTILVTQLTEAEFGDLYGEHASNLLQRGYVTLSTGSKYDVELLRAKQLQRKFMM